MVSRQKPKTKKQLTAEAQQAALEGRWEEAVKINDQMLERFPRDPEALNRKGRAFIELRQLSAARDAYTEALKADPANMIARRNLQRLEMLYNRPEGPPEGVDASPATIPNSAVFVEEVGRTWVDELTNPADLGVLAETAPGEKLHLEIQDGRLVVLNHDGARLGEIEARTGRRVIDLIEGGNRYEIYALGISGQSLRIILREVHRDPSQAGRMAFPRQVRGTQNLMRERELLFQRDQSDFLFGDDEEVDVEETEDDEEEDDEEGADVDASVYVDDTRGDHDDEDEM